MKKSKHSILKQTLSWLKHEMAHGDQGKLDYLMPILIFFFGYAFFIYRLDSVGSLYFDEVNYVTAARQFLLDGKNENWIHPPLGKAIIALGIWILGDAPMGWRVMSLISGGLTLVAMYYLGIILLKERLLAVQVVFLSAINQLLYVQSRIGMLDSIMFAFISIGTVFFLFYWQKGKSERYLHFSGLFFGMGMATKWFALVPLILCLGLLMIHEQLYKKRGRLLRELGVLGGFAAIGYLTSFLLCLTYIKPVHASTAHSLKTKKSAKIEKVIEQTQQQNPVSDFIDLQSKMLTAHTDYRNDSHPFMRKWYLWPLNSHITWYLPPYLADEPQLRKQGIGIFGNPPIMWAGILAILFCIGKFWKKRSKEALVIAVFYLGMYLSWVLIPRHITFYFYYFPAAMFLAPAIVYSFKEGRVRAFYQFAFSILCLVFFSYGYPLISNGHLSPDQFDQRHYVLTFGMGDYEFTIVSLPNTISPSQ